MYIFGYNIIVCITERLLFFNSYLPIYRRYIPLICTASLYTRRERKNKACKYKLYQLRKKNLNKQLNLCHDANEFKKCSINLGVVEDSSSENDFVNKKKNTKKTRSFRTSHTHTRTAVLLRTNGRYTSSNRRYTSSNGPRLFG